MRRAPGAGAPGSEKPIVVEPGRTVRLLESLTGLVVSVLVSLSPPG
jgi:hypothetical protein